MLCFRTTEMDIRPNHTIYVNRLNEKVKKEGRYGILLLVVHLNSYYVTCQLFYFSLFKFCCLIMLFLHKD